MSEQIEERPRQSLPWWLGYVLMLACLIYGASILERLPWSFTLNLTVYLCCTIPLTALLILTEKRLAKPPEKIREDRITMLVCALIVGLSVALFMLISFLLGNTVELLSAESAFHTGIFFGPLIGGWALARLFRAHRSSQRA